MHEKLEKLIDALSEADPQSGKDLIRAFVLDELFQFAGRSQCLFEPVIGSSGNLPLTSTMLTIAPSGAGKQRVKGTVDLVFGAYKKAYKRIIGMKKGQYNDSVQADAIVKYGERNDKNNARHESYLKTHGTNGFVAINDQVGTIQGIAHALDAMNRLKIGSYCHRVDECSSVITSTNQSTQEFVDALLSFSGGATGVSRTLKGEVLELDATGIAFNLHFFGNAEMLGENEKTLNNFRGFLRKGFSRRTLFTYIKDRIMVKREWLDLTPDVDKFKSTSTYFANLFERLASQENKVFSFEEEAKVYLKDYLVEHQFPTSNKDADNERGDHVFKAQKLACILALIEKSFLVTREHCLSAMAYVQESAKAYLELLGTVQDAVYGKTDAYASQILNAMLDGEPMSKRALSRHLQPIPRDTADAKWNPYIEEASRLAEEEGYFLLKERTSNQRGWQYRLETMQTTSDAMVTYSVKAPDVPEEPKRCLAHHYEVQTSTLEELALYSSFLHVSPAIFKGGHRTSENVEYLGNLAFFDVDNDDKSQDAMLTVEDAQSRLFGYQGVVIESMSSTVEQPRFRVVVVLDKVVKGVSKESYKQILNNIAKHLGIDGAIDKSCIEPSRYYAQTCHEAGEGIAYSNMYGKPLEWELFLGEDVAVSRPNIYSKVTLDFSHDEVKRRFHKAVKTAIKKHWRVGSRNSLSYYLAKLGREKGIPEDEIRELIEVESTNEGMPLDSKELKAVVTNSNRY